MAIDWGQNHAVIPDETLKNDAKGEMRVVSHIIRLYYHQTHGTPLNMVFEDGTSELFFFCSLFVCVLVGWLEREKEREDFFRFFTHTHIQEGQKRHVSFKQNGK